MLIQQKRQGETPKVGISRVCVTPSHRHGQYSFAPPRGTGEGGGEIWVQIFFPKSKIDLHWPQSNWPKSNGPNGLCRSGLPESHCSTDNWARTMRAPDSCDETATAAEIPTPTAQTCTGAHYRSGCDDSPTSLVASESDPGVSLHRHAPVWSRKCDVNFKL